MEEELLEVKNGVEFKVAKFHFIFAGKEIPLSNAPYQVSVQIKGKHECGGAIIAPNFIITAAHCTYVIRARDISVRVGTKTAETSGEVFTVKRVKTHPLFNPFSYNNDFSVIELTSKITVVAGEREIIELPAQDDPVTDGALTLVTGWGDTRKVGESKTTLRGVVIPIVNQQKCKQSYNILTSQMLCAGDYENGGKDSCQGKVRINKINVQSLYKTIFSIADIKVIPEVRNLISFSFG